MAARIMDLAARSLPSATAARSLSWTLVICMGLAQLVCWGTLHYLVALFAGAFRAEFGWSLPRVHSGFSVAMLVMAASSYAVGRWIDHRGGRAAMMAGCGLGAAGCLLLSLASSFGGYLGAWAVIGLGMRLALYDAAFATLAHIAHGGAKRAISVVTIFGGLASTVFWPLGEHLMELYGWRGALQWYVALLLASSLLHLAIPRATKTAAQGSSVRAAAAAVAPALPAQRAVQALYAYTAIAVVFVQTGMAAHFLGMLAAAGWRLQEAVWLATLLGLGQFIGRLVVALWAYRLHPVALNLVPAVLQVLSFFSYLLFGQHAAGALLFAFCYGAGNGMATYTRGAMPLVLFDPTRYGRVVGLVLKPALALAALAPVAFGAALQHWGAAALTAGALGLAASTAVAAVLLYSIVLNPLRR